MSTPKHRNDRHEDSCSLVCNAGYEGGGDCSTYLGRHDAQAFVTAINVISRLYERQLDAYCIGDPA